MAATMPVGITPAAAFRSINRNSASAVYIGLGLCFRHTIAEHTESQKAAACDYPTLAAINLRARQLFAHRNGSLHALARRRRSLRLNRAHPAHFARARPRKLNRTIGQSARRHSHMRRPHQRRPSKNRSRRLAAAKHTVRSDSFSPQPKANATPFPQVASLTCHVSIAYGYNVIINRSSFSLSQSFSIPSSSFLLGNLLLRRLRDQSLCLLTASRLSFGNKICLSARQSSPRAPVAFVFSFSAASIPFGSAGERIPYRLRFMWNKNYAIRQNLNVYQAF